MSFLVILDRTSAATARKLHAGTQLDRNTKSPKISMGSLQARVTWITGGFPWWNDHGRFQKRMSASFLEKLMRGFIRFESPSFSMPKDQSMFVVAWRLFSLPPSIVFCEEPSLEASAFPQASLWAKHHREHGHGAGEDLDCRDEPPGHGIMMVSLGVSWLCCNKWWGITLRQNTSSVSCRVPTVRFEE